jgi:ubiquinone/menaquinone biosynthesis C-methylase UbiE
MGANKAGVTTSGEATAQSIRQQFGAVAGAYAVSAVHASGADLARLVDAAQLQGGERVLDLGCGAGHTAIAFAARGAEVTGLDLTPEMVGVATDLAKQRGLTNVRFEVGDVAALPFADGTFAVVTSRYSAHHYGDPVAALSEAARVLAPGGRFLLVDTVSPEDAALDTYLNAFEFLRDPSHVRDWRASEWVRMLQAAGFSPRVLERSSVALQLPDWVQRMRTPPSKVAMLEELFRGANDAQRRAFEIEAASAPLTFSLPLAMLEGVKG